MVILQTGIREGVCSLWDPISLMLNLLIFLHTDFWCRPNAFSEAFKHLKLVYLNSFKNAVPTSQKKLLSIAKTSLLMLYRTSDLYRLHRAVP
jgi:hypothetical protein